MTGSIDEDGLSRTGWATSTALMRHYYDTEWGLPVVTEQGLYERLSLEGFQAGLSWATILGRREGFRRAFAGFQPEAVARFAQDDVERLVQDAGIIRSRAKITAVIGNARAVLALREEGPAALRIPRHQGEPLEIPAGLPALIWSFCPLTTPRPRDHTEVPTRSEESAALARELKRHGISFIGPTSAYALMEAVGMVDTHWVGSHRRGASGIFGPDGTRPAVGS